MEFSKLKQMMLAQGVQTLLVKKLAANDNSKNQIYLAGSFDILNVLPFETLREEVTEKGKRLLKGKLVWSWLNEAGSIHPANGAQLILYPQYPEVRLSGFLKGCDDAPNDLLRSRTQGRILFIGITSRRTCVAYATILDENLEKAIVDSNSSKVGAFSTLSLEGNTRERLLCRLREIVAEGWIESFRLGGAGECLPCNAPNCGGLTLEAKLGVRPNSVSGPDFLGWEIKTHSTSVLTLMTPEPTGGFYKAHGAEAFVRKWGYADLSGKANRLNFGGVHRCGAPHVRTGLTLGIAGYSEGKVDPSGKLALLDSLGVEAASWSFASILEHWNRKHANAAMIGCEVGTSPRRYRYADRVRLGVGTDFGKFLDALQAGHVYYDPGIKVENADSRPVTKRRSQFRINLSKAAVLYDRLDVEPLS